MKEFNYYHIMNIVLYYIIQTIIITIHINITIILYFLHLRFLSILIQSLLNLTLLFQIHIYK
jgi:hypothetical protein